MGGSYRRPRPPDGRGRDLCRRPAGRRAQRLAGVCDPDQQTGWRRLAAPRRSPGMRNWATARGEDAVMLLLTGAGLVLFLAPLFLGSRFPQPVLLFSALVA